MFNIQMFAGPKTVEAQHEGRVPVQPVVQEQDQVAVWGRDERGRKVEPRRQHCRGKSSPRGKCVITVCYFLVNLQSNLKCHD